MVRLRIKYEKKGPIRFVSHRDLLRIFRRCFASAGIPVTFSRGFNPHPRLSFGPSLRTGWEGHDEYMDVSLVHAVDDLPIRCTAHLPEGLQILETAILADSVRKLSADVAAARYEVSLDSADVFKRHSEIQKPLLEKVSDSHSNSESHRRSAVLNELKTAIRERFTDDRGENTPIGQVANGSPVILEVEVHEKKNEPDHPPTTVNVQIEYFSTMHGGKSVFPEDILTPFLGDPSEYATPIRVVRKALYVQRAGDYLSPISRVVVEKKV